VILFVYFLELGTVQSEQIIGEFTPPPNLAFTGCQKPQTRPRGIAQAAGQAYCNYLNAGSEADHDGQHWLAAEAQLISEQHQLRLS
jgi:hypothetical protein